MLSTREYLSLINTVIKTITQEEIDYLMTQTTDLSAGGIAIVMVGVNGLVPEFLTHPQVLFIECNKVEAGDELERAIPFNVKAVIITEGIPSWHYTWIISYAKRKDIPWLLRKTNQAVYDSLKSFFPVVHKPDPEEVINNIRRGKLKPLMEMVDYNESNATEAKRLLKVATERHITTTFGALAQAISNERKKRNLGTVPKSARNVLDVSVELLDKMIEDLGAMRDYLISTTEENRILKHKIEKIEQAFK